jgi:hypothetical protein
MKIVHQKEMLTEKQNPSSIILRMIDGSEFDLN